MENKQTAVEWLVNVVQSCIAPDYIPKEIIAQAKAMEKQQIMKAYGQGIADGAGEILDATKDAQQYYNKTYKSEHNEE